MKKLTLVLVCAVAVIGVVSYQNQQNQKAEEAARERAQRQAQIEAQQQSIYNVPSNAYSYRVPDYSSGNSYSGGSSVDTPELCGVCHGGGWCVTCDGTGIHEYLGRSYECSACDGTGDCWKCGGTGYQ